MHFRESLRASIETAANVSLILACAMVVGIGIGQLRKGRTTQPTAIGRDAERLDPALKIRISDAHVIGTPEAVLGIVEFADFQCPFCARYARETFKAIKAQFVDNGIVRYGFRHMPLENHSQARLASIGAECASLQRRFWPMHDFLFEHAGAPDRETLLAGARQIDLDIHTFEGCLTVADAEPVSRDVMEAHLAGVSSTPTFLVGSVGPEGLLYATRRIRGAQPLDVFRKTLIELSKTISRRSSL